MKYTSAKNGNSLLISNYNINVTSCAGSTCRKKEIVPIW